jgi:hypothetical protein
MIEIGLGDSVGATDESGHFGNSVIVVESRGLNMHVFFQFIVLPDDGGMQTKLVVISGS